MNSRSTTIALAALFVLVAQCVAGCAQSTPRDDGDLQGQLAAIKQDQDSLRKELAELRQLVQQGRPAAAPQRPQVAGMAFDLGDNPFKGTADASVVLLEFTDYQCPFCKRHTEQTQPSIQRDYVDTGKIRFVSFDMPIPSLHPLAFKASEAAHCAGDQGKFWEMRARLFAKQKNVLPWTANAEALGLDATLFDACLASDKYADAVRLDMAAGRRAGVSGTPSFVVALVDGDDPQKVQGFKFLRGAQPYAAFQRTLDEALLSLRK